MTEDLAGPTTGDEEERATEGEAQRASIRTRIDELTVQLDLADLDLREILRRQLDTAINVYLAARSRVNDAKTDAEGGLVDLRKALEQVLRDLRGAYNLANDVVRRSRS